MAREQRPEGAVSGDGLEEDTEDVLAEPCQLLLSEKVSRKSRSGYRVSTEQGNVEGGGIFSTGQWENRQQSELQVEKDACILKGRQRHHVIPFSGYSSSVHNDRIARLSRHSYCALPLLSITHGLS